MSTKDKLSREARWIQRLAEAEARAVKAEGQRDWLSYLLEKLLRHEQQLAAHGKDPSWEQADENEIRAALAEVDGE